jgi:hypothetical protein
VGWLIWRQTLVQQAALMQLARWPDWQAAAYRERFVVPKTKGLFGRKQAN